MASSNAELVSQAIESMNREREVAAQTAIKTTINSIVSQQKVIATAQTELARLRTHLSSITIEPANAADILG